MSKLPDPYEGKREHWQMSQQAMKERWAALNDKYLATHHQIQEDTAAFYEDLIASGKLIVKP